MTSARRSLNILASWGTDAAAPSRLIMAAKAAAASALAWYLAPLIPWTDDQYSYYAPLGVLVSMYSTVAGSAKSGAKALAGLAIGIAIGVGGLGLVAAGAPGVVTVAVVVGVGMLVGGIRALGTGRDWVSMAALFVLLISGTAAEEFSVSYLLNMAFGVLVGVVVNLLVAPPLYLRRAADRLSVLRDAVSARLNDIADSLGNAEVDLARLERAIDDLGTTVAAVAEEVREADESRRGNPRGRRTDDDQRMNARRLRALERSAFFTRDLADVFISIDEGRPYLGRSAQDELRAAIRACAALLATPVGDETGAARLHEATAALDAYNDALAVREQATPGTMADDLTAGVCVRRIIDASRPFV